MLSVNMPSGLVDIAIKKSKEENTNTANRDEEFTFLAIMRVIFVFVVDLST